MEFILCCLSFLGVLWNTYFTTTSLLKVCIPANNFCENGAYYSLQPEEKANDDVFLDVTIQLPVYLESFDEVIQLTLQSCLNSAKYYTTHTNATANIVVWYVTILFCFWLFRLVLSSSLDNANTKLGKHLIFILVLLYFLLD